MHFLDLPFNLPRKSPTRELISKKRFRIGHRLTIVYYENINFDIFKHLEMEGSVDVFEETTLVEATQPTNIIN